MLLLPLFPPLPSSFILLFPPCSSSFLLLPPLSSSFLLLLPTSSYFFLLLLLCLLLLLPPSSPFFLSPSISFLLSRSPFLLPLVLSRPFSCLSSCSLFFLLSFLAFSQAILDIYPRAFFQLFLHGNSLTSLHTFIHRDLLPAEFGGNQPEYDKESWLRTLLAKNRFQYTCDTMAAVAAQLNGHLAMSGNIS